MISNGARIDAGHAIGMHDIHSLDGAFRLARVRSNHCQETRRIIATRAQVSVEREQRTWRMRALHSPSQQRVKSHEAVGE